MGSVHWLSWVLAGGAIVAAFTLYPYIATAIGYRGSDNGLAYILLVMGVALWNAMFAAQLLDPHALVKGFFLSLSLVGASLAGLGWFLFAGTASSTRSVPRRRLAYGLAAIGVGINISLVITNPTHELYWVLPVEQSTSTVFVEIAPNLLYWLHTLQLVVLFSAGTALFFEAWRTGVASRYSRLYTIAGTGTVLAIVGSNTLIHGGLSIAPLSAASLTTVGWIQANRGHPLDKYRSYLPS
ncbi:histidine kinase N-terminal 7TM domain-containing protein [Halosolutus halophilus]|uniref:histidine kinase N-terminal 7TM domain-containing protein n=1 Tax=Halosolutus halophilus TaxID=1552990 RepID=UPI0022350523|nr:histidine kinase N-terminal 7TM domain-containing protein [Halosolutus halophilus]